MNSDEFLDDLSKRICLERAEETVAEIRSIIDTRYPPASRVGDPPAYRSGKLWWGYEAARLPEGDAVVLTDVAYSPYLEYGTSKMAPRPHIGPSVEVVRRRHS